MGHAVLGKRFSAARLRLPYLPAFAALAVAVHFGLMALLPVFGTQPLSAYDLYHSTNDMKQTTAHLGLMPAFRLDVHRLLFGFEGGEIELATETKAPMEAPTEAPTEPALPDATEPTVLPEPVVDTSPNVLELDFDAVPTEGNDVLSELNAYFSSRTPTNKNEKTGMFKGCNLILITAESFSYLAIDPELTPTLYKLQTEGFNFTNFYTPYWDVSTSDGEYAALTGTIPKPGTWSFRDSAENAMPLTMAQQLKRLGAVIFIHAHGEYRAQAERAHELHESAYPSLLAEAFRKLLRLCRAYALYLRQLLRRVFEHVQRLIAEFVDNERRRRGADAAHGSAREIFIDRGRGARQHTLRKLGLELPAVDAVRHPVAADDHGFAGRGVREAADDRHSLAVFVSQAQHGVAVLFIFINHGIDRAGQL